jgi:hypothetical protein
MLAINGILNAESNDPWERYLFLPYGSHVKGAFLNMCSNI